MKTTYLHSMYSNSFDKQRISLVPSFPLLADVTFYCLEWRESFNMSVCVCVCLSATIFRLYQWANFQTKYLREID